MVVIFKNDEIYIYYVLKKIFLIVKELKWIKNILMLDLLNDKYCGGGLVDNFIIIINLSEEDKGEYICIVLNVVGFVLKILKLG